MTARRIAITTLLNPKALIFGLVLLPAEDGARLGLHVALFSAQVVGVAMLWALLGAILRAGARPEPSRCWSGVQLWRRAAALWLGALAAYLVGRVVGFA